MIISKHGNQDRTSSRENEIGMHCERQVMPAGDFGMAGAGMHWEGSSRPGAARWTVPVILLLLAACVALPACAGEKYLTGTPDLSAAIRGSNEFYPGDEVTIPVVIQNSGLLEYTFTYPTTLTPVDLPSTAKLMVVSLSPGDAPVTVLSDPQMAGDLKGGSSVAVNFQVRVSRDAPAGTYRLPLLINYTYLYASEQYGQDALHYLYREKGETLGLSLLVKPKVIAEVIAVEPESVFAGGEGYLTVRVRNAGNENGRNAVASLLQSGTSPVTPVSGENYVGDFPPGTEKMLRYRVGVLRNAEAGTYPMDLVVEYTSSDGKTARSDIVTIGVPVEGEITFDVVSTPAPVYPGTKQFLEVDYRNSGEFSISGAQARLYPLDPFTSGDDLSYLGDMAPGETRTARFEVTVDREAPVKEYGLDTEIRYRDRLGNDQVSDRMRIPISVTRQTGIQALLSNPAVMVLIVIAMIVAIFFLVSRRKKVLPGLIKRNRGEKGQ